MLDSIPGYTVSVAQRTPNQTLPASFTELAPVYASGLSWGEELNREGDHTVSTSPETLDPAIISRILEWLDNDDDVPGLELWIYRDANLVARGPIIGVQVQGEANTWTFRAAGPLYYLRYMHLAESATLTFTGVDQHTIGKTLIDDWQDLDYGHYGLDTSAIGASGVTRDRVYDPGDNVFQRLTELAEVDNGFDVWVDLDDLGVNFGVKGSDLTGSVVLDRRGITNAGLAVSFAAGDLASEAYGTNTAEMPLSSEKSNVTLRQSFGRSGVVGSFDGVTVQTTLDDHVQAMLDARARPLISPQPQLIPVAGAGVDDFQVGDTVQFAPRIGVDGLLLERRVLTRTVSVSETGQETMGVGFA